jgi:sugar/nucleoside kinase (ribokinase family)
VTVSYLILGHIAKDLTPSGSRLGGTAAYAGLTAQALGYTPGLVTAYDSNLDLLPLAALACARVSSSDSTTFENVYGPAGRYQYLRAQAAPLSLAAIPAAWRSAPIIHIGPIVHEVSTDAVRALASPGRLVGLTPQGWLRQWDDKGRVSYRPWAEADEVLPFSSAMVLSIEDVQGDWETARHWAGIAKILVVTEGAHGCTVFVQGQPARNIPAPTLTEVDPTGAGDIFAAAFFIQLYETQSPYRAAQFANAVAAQSVTRPGLAGTPTEAETRRHRMTPE